MHEDTKWFLIACVTFTICIALMASCEKCVQRMKESAPVQVK